MADEVNVFGVALRTDPDDPPGYRDVGYARLGPLLGSTLLGMTVFELPPTTRSCPYHYELGDEEWVIVLQGSATLRTPEGETQLGPWDVACFPAGEAGAHQLRNDTAETVRFAMLSTKNEPAATIYPDSNKVGVWPPGKLFRLDDAVDYWEGEP